MRVFERMVRPKAHSLSPMTQCLVNVMTFMTMVNWQNVLRLQKAGPRKGNGGSAGESRWRLQDPTR
jgi:hypothetical protein